MGIQGLLPFVQKACRPCRMSEFRGCTVAVDACCWLHKGVFGCADQLAVGVQTDLYVRYCMRFVNALLSDGLKVIMVFDGASLPAKKRTNETRKQRREIAREKGHRSLAEGNGSEASMYFRQSVNITFEMISNVIEACKALNRSDVTCIVAPYEADAQLAYLNLNGFAELVVSEDSDLILFGCKKIVFKYDRIGGNLYDEEQLPCVLTNGRRELDFTAFRRACILSGCDYASGLPGFGLKKAIEFFWKVSSGDIRRCLKRIPLVMNTTKVKVTDEYVEQFVAAENTFLYQLVFDPIRRALTPLNPYGDGLNAEVLPYAGKRLNDQVATEIATGNVCPNTHRRHGGSASTRQLPMQLKSPMKALRKSPRKSRSSPAKTAFEINHVRCVRRSPQKTVEAKAGSGSWTFKSPQLAAYAMHSGMQLTRSRYFATPPTAALAKRENRVIDQPNPTIHSNVAAESDQGIRDSITTRTPLSSKKRTIFDVLDEDGGEESGFYEASSSFDTSMPLATSSPCTSDGAKRLSRSIFATVHEKPPLLLSSLAGNHVRFNYNSLKNATAK